MLFPTDGGTIALKLFVRSNGGLKVLTVCMKEELHFAIHNIVEEFSILCILHNHKDIILSLDDLIELCNGRMPD